METIVKHAQGLVYSLLCLMPSLYQKASFNAMLGLFLEAQGHPLPQHTRLKSASALSRFLNRYRWSTRALIRTTRQAILQQVAQHPPHKSIPLRVIVDLTTLEKCGKFLHLSTAVDTLQSLDPWIRMLNGKRGLHLVTLYLEIGEWRVPWSFRVWRGKGHPSPAQLAAKRLASVPRALSQGRTVIVQGDSEFGTVDFLTAARARTWRAATGVRCHRRLTDGRTLQQLYRTEARGIQVYLEHIPFPLTISWFWLKRSDGQRELRFIASTYPDSGAYLVVLGRRR
jgi:hypothetical protein